MSDFTLSVDHPEPGVRRIRWMRPGRLNAFTNALYQAILDAVTEAGADDSVRVLWLTGDGGAFSAGNDLEEFERAPTASLDAPVFRLLSAVAAFAKPLVMTPAGPAIGIGTTLCLHADFVNCTRGTRFQMPFVALGLCPEGGSSLLVPQLVGQARAMSWLLLGSPIAADEALQTGLVNAVCDDEVTLETETLTLVRRLAALPPAAVIAAKALIKDNGREAVRTALVTEGREFIHRLTQPEAREALAAFREKRRPVFR